MMANKHLHELLQEDQEPFHLKNYIADRKSQLKNPIPKASLQPRKRKPLVESSLRKACFLSFQYSPDVRKSPLIDYPLPAMASKSPSKSPKSVRLHIPARTAALLFEAALKIQKQSSKKPKNQIKNLGFGLFGSIFKRLGNKNWNRKCEIGCNGERKSDGKVEKVRENVGEISAFEKGFSCSCSNSRRDSGIWSESNEDKSLDLETSSSYSRWEEMEDRESGRAFGYCEKHFCSSPMSPFRFALQHCPSPGLRTPVFSSPASSPSRHRIQENENCEAERVLKSHLEEEEEEKEQFSPVSVLDPPFEDDEDGGNEDGDDDYDLECSYEFVQRAKQQLLHKLRRFEQLAELDPMELEKRMLEEQDDEDGNEHLEQEDEELEEAIDALLSQRENKVDGFINNVLSQSDVSGDMKKLVFDLVNEEKRDNVNGEIVARMVCRRLASWKEVQQNTIDMMVELDFGREIEGWKGSDKEEVDKTAVEIEVAIFGLLVEELSEELLYLPGF